MAKRFPVPEFDYEDLRGRSRAALRLLEPGEVGEAPGIYPIPAPDSLRDHFSFTGDHLAALRCVPPPGGATMTGRSHAWYIQRALVLDSLDATEAAHDWITPRPMNTRLGPTDGVRVSAPLYLLLGHRFADHWIANRVAEDEDWKPEAGSGFRVISADGDEQDDFHAAVVTFTWTD